MVCLLLLVAFLSSPFEKINNFVRESSKNLESLFFQEIILPEEIIKDSKATLLEFHQKECVFRGDTIISDTLYVFETTYIHYGNIYVIDNGVILIKNAEFLNYGDIWLLDNGKLLADSSVVGFLQVFSWQFNFFTADSSELRLENSHFYANLFPALVNCGYNSHVSWINTYFDDWIAGFLCNQAEITIENCYGLVGEYAFSDSTCGTFAHSGSLNVWLVFEEGDTVDYSPFYEEFVPRWTFPDSLLLCKGVDYIINIDSCYISRNGPWFHSGSHVTVRNAEVNPIIRASGSDSFNISGLTSGTYYSNWVLPISDRYFHLIDTRVANWHLHMQDTSVVALENNIISEILCMENSFLHMKNTIHDGTGGPFWIYGKSFVFAEGCYIGAETFLVDSGVLVLSHGYLNSEFCLEGAGKAALLNSRSFYAPKLFDSTALFFASIDSPTVASQADSVPIYGSAYIDGGPECPFSFGSYRLWYASPPTWDSLIPIGLEHSKEIRDSLLEYWCSDSLTEGYYILWLMLKDNFGDSIQTYSMVRVGGSNVEENERYKVKNIKLKVHPNPFSTTTTITLKLPSKERRAEGTELNIYDITGRLVKDFSLPTTHSSLPIVVSWDGKNDSGEKVRSGIYFCKLKVGNKFSQTKKLIFLR